MNISIFEQPTKRKDGQIVPATKPNATMDFVEYLNAIKWGKWEKPVLDYRAGRIPKTAIPGVTPSGVFSYRNISGLVEHSGIIALDFDKKDNEEFPADEVAGDPFTLAMHKSVSGEGWVVYVLIVKDKHLDSYLALEKHFANEYQLIADPSGKDIPRFRFVSVDPELYHNPAAKVWRRYLPKKTAMPTGKVYVSTRNDIEHCINQITNRGINIAEDYHTWLKLGWAFAAEFGEQGREYFHAISAISTKYNQEKCDKKYNNLLKTSSGKVGIASFYWECKNCGIEIKTPRTAHVERVAKMQRKLVGVSGGLADKDAAASSAKKVLNDIDNIYGEDVDSIIDQVMALPEGEIANDDTFNLLEETKNFLRSYSMQFNEITRNVELENEILTDRLFNSIYIKAIEVIGNDAKKGRSVNKDFLFSLIDSDFTPSYNPFTRFFDTHSNLKPKGLIDQLIRCLKIPNLAYDQETVVTGKEYATKYIKKWLMSCVASWHGTYSVMMLVFNGKQMTGKTNFFRWILPDDLIQYYAESRLDAGKDDEILMCQKAIICDDEYGGKNKLEYKRLKELISKQSFSIRRPYGRITEDLQRVAVLCGTSNEEEIINDPTGNRRIIPVEIDSIDWVLYKSIDKTALWMEIYHEWRTVGDGWMLTKEDVAILNKLTIKNEQRSIEEESIFMFFASPESGGFTEYLSNTEILNYIQTNSQLKLSPTKLGLMLKKAGFEKKKRWVNGVVKLCYEVVKINGSLAG